MDTTCLEHCLTEPERVQFDDDGYLIIEDVLPAELVDQLAAVVDRLDTEYRPKRELGPHDSLNLLDFVGKDELFLELLDWPKTFPKVWGILGWHIQLYHSHVIVTPPMAAADRRVPKRLGWHQDSGRLNRDLEGNPRSRISLKVAFFLTDTSIPGRGRSREESSPRGVTSRLRRTSPDRTRPMRARSAVRASSLSVDIKLRLR